MATHHEPDAYSRVIEQNRKKYYGTFDTGLACVCGKGDIMDHALQSNPNAHPVPIRDMVFGPSPSYQERLAAMTVHHAYWCEHCGLEYRGDVVEGVRAYEPLEKREPMLTSRDVRFEHAESDVAALFEPKDKAGKAAGS